MSPTPVPNDPLPPRLTDTHRLEQALTRLRTATVNFYGARADRHDALAAFAQAEQELHLARCDVDMLTRLNDDSAIPGRFMGSPKAPAAPAPQDEILPTFTITRE